MKDASLEMPACPNCHMSSMLMECWKSYVPKSVFINLYYVYDTTLSEGLLCQVIQTPFCGRVFCWNMGLRV